MVLSFQVCAAQLDVDLIPNHLDQVLMLHPQQNGGDVGERVRVPGERQGMELCHRGAVLANHLQVHHDQLL